MKGKEAVILELTTREAEAVVVEIKVLAERADINIISCYPYLHSLREALLNTLGVPDPKP
jgi:hypothetical protein